MNQFRKPLQSQQPRPILAKFHGLWKRLLSSLILIAILVMIFYLGSPWLEGLILVTVMAMFFECCVIVSKSNKASKLIEKMIWVGLGLAVMVILALSMIGLARQSLISFTWVLVLVSATDIGAFFVGRAVGGAKLAPIISPNKTWAGLCGGIFFSLLGNFIFNYFVDGTVGILAIFSVLIAIVAQIGDLGESWFKRHFAQKDSGNWIPGHGGILDRADGLLLVMPMMYVLSSLLGAPPLKWQWHDFAAVQRIFP